MAVTHCNEHFRPVHSRGLRRRQTLEFQHYPKQTPIIQPRIMRMAAWVAAAKLGAVEASPLAASLACAAFSANAAGAGADHLVAAAMRTDDVHEHVSKRLLHPFGVAAAVAHYHLR